MGVRMKAHNNNGFLLRFVMPGVNRLATPLGIDNTEIGISLQGFPFEKGLLLCPSRLFSKEHKYFLKIFF